MHTTTDWSDPAGIAAVAACASAFAALITAWSLVLLKRQISFDHERSRRERALDILMCFVNTHTSTDHQITYAMALIYKFNSDQCRSLWKAEPFTVDEKQVPYLETYRKAFY